MHKKISFITFFLTFSSALFCGEAVSTMDLLLSYLENDNDLKKYAIEVEKAQLSLDSTKISNGFDVSLSSGDVTFKSDETGMKVSAKPSVTASIPQASNLSVSVSTDYSFDTSSSDFNDTKLSASIDVFSTNGLSRKIALMKSKRNLVEAKRKLRSQAINTEKAFYTELKELLTDTNSIISAEKTLYSDKVDFEKIKAQGYSESSSTYRLAQMSVISAEHDIENSKRALIHSYVVFYKKCGYERDFEDDMDFFKLIPSDIGEVEPIDIYQFSPDLYSEVESALWTNEINTLQRKLNSNFSLGLSGGTTFNNSATSSNTIDAGINSTIGGISIGAEVDMPLESGNSPAFTFSASVSPNTFRQNSITKQTGILNEEQELLEIETARSNYENQIVDYQQNLETLIWTKKTNQESYEMYSALEKDLKNWFDQGFVTESEYYSAKVNAQSYFVKNVINAIDFIIYNDNVITMFVEDISE